MPSTVFLRTTFTRTMRLHYQKRWLVLLKFNILHMLPLSSNHLLYCYVTWLFWTTVSNHNLWHLWSTTVSNFTSCRLLQDNLSYHRLTARIFLRPVNILRMVWYGMVYTEREIIFRQVHTIASHPKFLYSQWTSVSGHSSRMWTSSYKKGNKKIMNHSSWTLTMKMQVSA